MLLHRYFPAIAAKYRACDEYWRKTTNGEVKTLFSLFFCVAINIQVLSRVITVPHRDFKNVAIGLCALFVLGKFRFDFEWIEKLLLNVLLRILQRQLIVLASELRGRDHHSIANSGFPPLS